MKKLEVFLLCFILLFLTGCGKKAKLVEKLDYEINSDLKLSDLIIQEEGIEVVNKDEMIDTSKLGEKEVIIKYLADKKENFVSIKINVVDTTIPEIEAPESISITKGQNINLLEKVKVSDNSDEEIKATVEGEYDINKVGDYKLKYVATDSSGNKEEKEFTLTVKNVTVKTSGYYIYKTSKQWTGVRFKTGNKVEVVYNFCPGSACGGYIEYGTYKVNGNKVTINLTYAYDDIGEKIKLNTKTDFTINSDSQIAYKNNKYNWKKSFS